MVGMTLSTQELWKCAWP